MELDNDKRNPFSDEVELTDPGNLVTGSGSHMFGNERLDQKTKKLVEAKREEQKSQLIPVANDLLEMLAAKKSANADIRSYMQRVRGDGTKKQLTKAQLEQLAIQAEAREMNIALIEEIEGWIRNRLRRTT